eukprot:351233-Chlamydomonas_euryale.AAC.2
MASVRPTVDIAPPSRSRAHTAAYAACWWAARRRRKPAAKRQTSEARSWMASCTEGVGPTTPSLQHEEPGWH